MNIKLTSSAGEKTLDLNAGEAKFADGHGDEARVWKDDEGLIHIDPGSDGGDRVYVDRLGGKPVVELNQHSVLHLDDIDLDKVRIHGSGKDSIEVGQQPSGQTMTVHHVDPEKEKDDTKVAGPNIKIITTGNDESVQSTEGPPSLGQTLKVENGKVNIPEALGSIHVDDGRLVYTGTDRKDEVLVGRPEFDGSFPISIRDPSTGSMKHFNIAAPMGTVSSLSINTKGGDDDVNLMFGSGFQEVWQAQHLGKDYSGKFSIQVDPGAGKDKVSTDLANTSLKLKDNTQDTVLDRTNGQITFENRDDIDKIKGSKEFSTDSEQSTAHADSAKQNGWFEALGDWFLAKFPFLKDLLSSSPAA